MVALGHPSLGGAKPYRVAVSIDRRPGEGKYARPERERRWLLAALPGGTHGERQIVDRYLDGTTLRLRRVEDTETVVFKLGQKVRPVTDDPYVVHLTNLYLTVGEYDRLAVLPAAVLEKSRRLVLDGETTYAVDEFHGALTGLLLAETEGAPTELPPWLGREVTHDDRFSGGALARATAPPVGLG